jgi:hypothetical protein
MLLVATLIKDLGGICVIIFRIHGNFELILNDFKFNFKLKSNF